MNTLSRNSLSIVVACLGVASSSVAPAQPLPTPVAAAPSTPCTELRLTALERRIVDKASQGIVPLRQYVSLTRAIYHLDLQDTVDWYTAHRARSAACARPIAGAAKS